MQDETLAVSSAKLVNITSAYNKGTGTCWIEMVAPSEREAAYPVGLNCLVNTHHPICLLLLNLHPYPIRVTKGSLVGHMYNPQCHLQKAESMLDNELIAFREDVVWLRNLLTQVPPPKSSKEGEVTSEPESRGPKTSRRAN